MKNMKKKSKKEQNKAAVKDITIIDYGAGNINSVKNALDSLNVKSKIINTPDEISSAGRIILPGVGNFGFMMKQLRKKKLEAPIKNSITSGKPFLGICLGLQALFEESEESPGVKGLGIFKGRVVKFRDGKVPQIGWNKIMPVRNKENNKRNKRNNVRNKDENNKNATKKDKSNKNATKKDGIFNESYMYFVNSYYVLPDDKSIVAAKTDYNGKFVSAIQFKNITAVQFHPEKSSKQGLELLKKWLRS